MLPVRRLPHRVYPAEPVGAGRPVSVWPGSLGRYRRRQPLAVAEPRPPTSLGVTRSSVGVPAQLPRWAHGRGLRHADLATRLACPGLVQPFVLRFLVDSFTVGTSCRHRGLETGRECRVPVSHGTTGCRFSLRPAQSPGKWRMCGSHRGGSRDTLSRIGWGGPDSITGAFRIHRVRGTERGVAMKVETSLRRRDRVSH